MKRHAGKEPPANARCAITGELLSTDHLIHVDHLRTALLDRIRRDYPTLSKDAMISRHEVDRYRTLYVEDLLKEERGELTEIDQQVARSLAEGELVSQNVEQDYRETRTVAQSLADGLAAFGGSWSFLIAFSLGLAIWITLNSFGQQTAFDPYPFILLNLILSSLAAIQAPIIMMSQKRQEAKDRLRSLSDYRVNLKAELEIRHLHEKMDHLISRQWQKLAEIQELQIELLQDRQ